MAKTTISLPDALLIEIDARADAVGTTRSGFVQEATARYIADLDAEAARADRARRIAEAIASMREVAAHMPRGTDGTQIIRTFRDRSEPWERKSHGDDE